MPNEIMERYIDGLEDQFWPMKEMQKEMQKTLPNRMMMKSWNVFTCSFLQKPEKGNDLQGGSFTLSSSKKLMLFARKRRSDVD